MKRNSKDNIRRSGRGAALVLSLGLLLSACGAAAPAETEAPEPDEPTSAGVTVPLPEADPTPLPTVTPEPSPAETEAPAEQPGGVAMFYSPATEYPEMPALMAETNLSHPEKIQRIRDWYYTTEDPGAALEQHEYDEQYSSFWLLGSLVRADVRETVAPGHEILYHYYYHEAMPYFAYIVDQYTGAELRLYFWNGELIRYIESDGIVRDYSSDSYADYVDGMWGIFQIMNKLE